MPPEEPTTPEPEATPAGAAPPADDNSLGQPSTPDEPAGPDASAEPAPDGADEGEQDKPPEDEPSKRRPSRRDRRIAELNRQLAEERAEKALLLQAAQRGQPAQPGQANGDADPMPREQDFSDWGEFQMAQTRWAARQELRDYEARRTQRDQEALAERTNAEINARWAESHEAALDAHDDYEDIYDAVGTRIDAAQAQAIKQADNPADVVYYLGKNPKEFARFRETAPQDLLKAVGRYEERIEAQRQRRSQAPEPVKPVRGQDAAPPNALSDNLTMDEWQRRRNKQVHGG